MGLFSRKCKLCKQKISKDRKLTEFCSEEHQEEWRSKNLTVWQKNLIGGIEKYTAKGVDKKS